MLKKMMMVLLGMLSLQTTLLFASEPVTIHIQFDGKASDTLNDNPLHINKTLRINAKADDTNYLVMTQSTMKNNLPVTFAMLVNPVVDGKNDLITLQFNLVNYGLNQNGKSIAQPKLILKNGQIGEMMVKNAYDLKVKAEWKQVTPVN